MTTLYHLQEKLPMQQHAGYSLVCVGTCERTPS